MTRKPTVLALSFFCLLAVAFSSVSPENETTKSGIEATTEATPAESTTGSETDNSTAINETLQFLSGFQGGTYDRIARSIASLPGMRMRVATSKGSIENIKAIRDGSAQVAIAQLDILIKFALKREKLGQKVKILLPLYNEEVHVLAKPNVRTLDQLEDRVVSLGPKESGTAATARIILAEIEIESSIRKVRATTALGQKKLLAGDGLDAMFIVAGAPVELLSSMPGNARKKVSLVPIDEEIYQRLIKQGMPYTMTTIKKKTYKWLRRNTETLAVGSAIIVDASVSNSSIQAIVNAVFAHRQELKKKHRKWREFDKGLAMFYLNAYRRYFHPAAAAAIDARK